MSPELCAGSAGLFALFVVISFVAACSQAKISEAGFILVFTLAFAIAADTLLTCSLVYWENTFWAVVTSLLLIAPLMIFGCLALIGKDGGTVFFGLAVVMPTGIAGFYAVLFFLPGIFVWTTLLLGGAFAVVAAVILVAGVLKS